MKNKILCVLLACAFMLTVVACGSNSSQEESGNLNDSTVNENEQSTASTDSEVLTSGPSFDKVEIDLYNEVTDSQYVSVILHNPESRVMMSQKSEGTKPVVLVYDMESSMKDTFTSDFVTYADINNFAHRFTVVNDKYAIYDGGTSADFADGFTHIASYEIKENKEGSVMYNFTLKDEDTAAVDYFILEEKETDDDYDATGSFFKNISNDDHSWHSSVALSDGEIMPDTYIDNISIKLAGNDEYNYYFRALLKTPLLYNENVNETINSQLSTLTVGDIRVIDSVNDLDSVVETYGEQYDIKLSDTVFYQDIIASMISENYGLNIKDKMEYYETDNLYICYIHTSNESGVAMEFTYEREDYVYSDFSDYSDASKFEYTDIDGNKFSYFSSTSGIFIFKNDEFTHTKIVLEKVDDTMNWYTALGQSFGIRY